MQSKNLQKLFYFFIYFLSIILIIEVIHNKNFAYCFQITLEAPLGSQRQGITDSTLSILIPESEEENTNTSQYALYISELFSLFKDCVSDLNACLHIHYFLENYEYFYYKSLPYVVPFIIYLAAKKYNELLLQIKNPIMMPAHSSVQTAPIELEFSYSCAICHDSEKKGGIVLLFCSHHFHGKCLQHYLSGRTLSQGRDCPICHAPVNQLWTFTFERFKEIIEENIKIK